MVFNKCMYVRNKGNHSAECTEYANTDDCALDWMSKTQPGERWMSGPACRLQCSRLDMYRTIPSIPHFVCTYV
jgi:hypothetical protein